jgi:hypothetical protein
LISKKRGERRIKGLIEMIPFDVFSDDDRYRNGSDNPATIEFDNLEYLDYAITLGVMPV